MSEQNFSDSYPEGTTVSSHTDAYATAPTCDIIVNLGTEPRKLCDKLRDTINVKDFGAKGDGVSDDSDALDVAIQYCGGRGRLFIPAGIYLISRMIRIPSRSYIFGAGIDKTIIKASTTTPRWTTLLHTGGPGDKRQHIHLRDITVDGNILNRLENQEGIEGVDWVTGAKALRGSNICICHTEHAVVERLRSIDPALHCLDVTGASYYGSGTSSSNGDSFSVNDESSRYITVADCYCEGGSDDNITTHQSSDIIIRGCISRNPTGRQVSNSNAFEIDDGSRNIHISDCIATGARTGFQIKGHDGQAAAYNVSVVNCKAYNCSCGLHTTHAASSGIEAKGDAESLFAAGGKAILDTEGQPVNIFGLSPTGRNVVVSNLLVCAPRAYTTVHGETKVAWAGVAVTRYSDVLLDNVTITEGYYETGLEYDYLPATSMSGAPLNISTLAENVSANNIHIVGFRPYLEAPDNSGLSIPECSVYLGKECRNIKITNISIREGRPYGIYSNNVDTLTLDNFSIISHSRDGRNICGVFLNAPEYVDAIGTGTVQGYPVEWQLTNQRSAHKIVNSRLYIGQNNAASEDSLQKTLSLYNVVNERLQRVYLNKASGPYGSVGLYAENPSLHLCGLYFDGTNADLETAASGIVSSYGDFTPRVTNTFSCGSSSRLWTQIWAADGVIQTSDARLKEDITPIDEAALRAWSKVELRQFFMADAVAKKGKSKARLHTGMVAQQIKEVFESEGLDATRYGLLCYDEWDDQYAVDQEVVQTPDYNEETGKEFSPGVTREKRELFVSAGTRYSVRYDEALIMEAAYQRWRLKELENRLAVLEKRMLAE